MIKEVLDVMVELAEEGMTMIVVTHEMGFARQVGDRIMFIDDGEILEEAQPDRFFSAPSDERTKRFLGRILDPMAAAQADASGPAPTGQDADRS
jgi:ABC-type polar amino acid transport system ATPase subunit